MDKTILKQVLEIKDLQRLHVLADGTFKPLYVGTQVLNGVECPVLWYESSTNFPKPEDSLEESVTKYITVDVRTIGTGQQAIDTESHIYVGTYQLKGFVGHIYLKV